MLINHQVTMITMNPLFKNKSYLKNNDTSCDIEVLRYDAIPTSVFIEYKIDLLLNMIHKNKDFKNKNKHKCIILKELMKHQTK